MQRWLIGLFLAVLCVVFGGVTHRALAQQTAQMATPSPCPSSSAQPGQVSDTGAATGDQGAMACPSASPGTTSTTTTTPNGSTTTGTTTEPGGTTTVPAPAGTYAPMTKATSRP